MGILNKFLVQNGLGLEDSTTEMEFAADTTVKQAVEESDLPVNRVDAELDEMIAEAEAVSKDADEIQDAAETTEALESLVATMESGALTQRELNLALNLVGVYCDRLHVKVPTTISLEAVAAEEDLEARTRVSCEGLRDLLKKLWDVVSGAWDSLWGRFKGLLEKFKKTGETQQLQAQGFLGALGKMFKWDESARFTVSHSITSVLGKHVENIPATHKALTLLANGVFSWNGSLWTIFWSELDHWDGSPSGASGFTRGVLPDSSAHELPGAPTCSAKTKYKVVFSEVEGADATYERTVGKKDDIKKMLNVSKAIADQMVDFAELGIHSKAWAGEISEWAEKREKAISEEEETTRIKLLKEDLALLKEIMATNVAYLADLAPYVVSVNRAFLDYVAQATAAAKA